MNTRNALLAALVLLAACGRPVDELAVTKPGSKDSADVTPAIIPPAEVADPTMPPSYEVAIAEAAAARNTATERCARQPESVRTQCQQEANAAFAASEAGLQDLRGNQP